jgi:hypothetical protein
MCQQNVVNPLISNFMKMCSVIPEFLLQMDRKMEKHDEYEYNRHIFASLHYECPKNEYKGKSEIKCPYFVNPYVSIVHR